LLPAQRCHLEEVDGELTGRRALVIGAGTEAGRAIALALADAGADVAVAAATIDGEEVMAVRRTRRAVVGLGRRSAEYAFDISLGQNVQVSTRQVSKELGGLDLLVNAQEAVIQAPADRMSDSDWSRALTLNLSGAFFACRAAAREMSATGGSIVNVLREAGGLEQAAAFAAAQAGLLALTQALAVELRERNIRVNAIVTDHDAEAEVLGGLAVFLASDTQLSGQVLRAPARP
jgi:NAD(P)-dependent dehydrogenase (short-subunit alcohol dehydrogenase family)